MRNVLGCFAAASVLVKEFVPAENTLRELSRS